MTLVSPTRLPASPVAVPLSATYVHPDNSLRLRLLARRTQGNTKADKAVADRRLEPGAVRRPTNPGAAEPTAATAHAVRASSRTCLTNFPYGMKDTVVTRCDGCRHAHLAPVMVVGDVLSILSETTCSVSAVSFFPLTTAAARP
jgi:hypothetical protein